MNDNHKPEFIAEMKERLIQEKQQLLKELGLLTHKEGDEYKVDFPEYGRHDEDNATEVADFGAKLATSTVAEERLAEVDAALERIEKGSYGVTSDGEVIPEARLNANPAATTIVKR